MSISYRIIISYKYFRITNFNIHLFHSNKYYYTSVCYILIHKIAFWIKISPSVSPPICEIKFSESIQQIKWLFDSQKICDAFRNFPMKEVNSKYRSGYTLCDREYQTICDLNGIKIKCHNYHSLLNLGLIIAKAEETKESLYNRIYF